MTNEEIPQIAQTIVEYLRNAQIEAERQLKDNLAEAENPDIPCMHAYCDCKDQQLRHAILTMLHNTKFLMRMFSADDILACLFWAGFNCGVLYKTGRKEVDELARIFGLEIKD